MGISKGSKRHAMLQFRVLPVKAQRVSRKQSTPDATLGAHSLSYSVHPALTLMPKSRLADCVCRFDLRIPARPSTQAVCLQLNHPSLRLLVEPNNIQLDI